MIRALSAFKSKYDIARIFFALYPHFKNGLETESLKQWIMDQCQKYMSDPQTTQYQIIREAIQHRKGDRTPILHTHQRWRDHERQNILYQLKDIAARCEAGKLDPKTAKAVTYCLSALQKFLDDYDKLEATRQKFLPEARR